MDNADHVVAFDRRIGPTERSDIRALLQDSDRAASSIHDRETFWDAWRLYYNNCLERHGCSWLASVTTQPLFISKERDLDSLELNIKGYSEPKALFDLAQRVMGGMGIREFVASWLAGDGTGDARLLSWVIVPCQINDQGGINITTFGIQVKGLPLTTQQKPELVMRFNGGIYGFDPVAYAPYRDAMRARLQGIALRKLGCVEL